MSGGVRYVPPKVLADLFLGAMYWSGLALPDPEDRLGRAARWYGELVGRGYEGLPFAAVFDLGTLLLEGPAVPLGVREQFDLYPGHERARRVRYGAGYLGAATERPWFLRAHDLIVASQAPDDAVVFALESLLAPLDAAREDGLVLQPARFPQLPWGRLAREVTEAEPLVAYRESRDRFEAWSREEAGAEADLLGRELDGFAARAGMRGARALLGEVELFELKHIDKLDTRERRLAARQLRRAELLLGEVDLSAMGRPPEVAEVDTDLEDEGTYPSGGLGGLSTRGTWENLVRSELVYMGEKGEVDLFAVRMAENELLFYTRDGGTLRRRRRRVHLVLERDADLGVKFPEHPLPVDRLLEGLLASLIRDLLEAFEGDACRIEVHQRGPGAEASAELLRLRFTEEVDRGEVAVHVVEDLDPEEFAEARRKNYCLWIGAQGAGGRPRHRALRAPGGRAGRRPGGRAGAAPGRRDDGLPRRGPGPPRGRAAGRRLGRCTAPRASHRRAARALVQESPWTTRLREVRVGRSR